jgi:hypothetical protein
MTWDGLRNSIAGQREKNIISSASFSQTTQPLQQPRSAEGGMNEAHQQSWA